MEENSLERLFQLAIEKIGDASLQEELQKLLQVDGFSSLPTELLEDSEEETPENTNNIAQIIKNANMALKIKLAMFGNLACRNILIRDRTPFIPMMVLDNPKLTENEILDLAKNTQISEAILRAIGNNLNFMKSYPVKIALISNPKAPIDVSIRWIKYLKARDIGRLAKSKNIPQVVATQCRKLAEKKS